MQTTVKDDAGKEATWDETFVLENVFEAVLNGEELVMTAWDEDNVQNDLLCEARPKLYQDLVTNEQVQNHCVDLYDLKKKTEKYGTLWYSTKYRFIPPSPIKRKMVDGANVSLWKGLSSHLGSIDKATTDGMREHIKVKIQEHNQMQLQARIQKLSKENDRAKKRMMDTKRQEMFINKINNMKKNQYELRKDYY